MENPAEETTVRPNQNQTTRDWTDRVQITNLLPMKKNCNISCPVSPISWQSIQSKTETSSPFFGNQYVKIAMAKVDLGK